MTGYCFHCNHRSAIYVLVTEHAVFAVCALCMLFEDQQDGQVVQTMEQYMFEQLGKPS